MGHQIKPAFYQTSDYYNPSCLPHLCLLSIHQVSGICSDYLTLRLFRNSYALWKRNPACIAINPPLLNIKAYRINLVCEGVILCPNFQRTHSTLFFQTCVFNDARTSLSRNILSSLEPQSVYYPCCPFAFFNNEFFRWRQNRKTNKENSKKAMTLPICHLN